MTNGSCQSTHESNVQTWLNPPASARWARSMTRRAGGSVCSTKPISMSAPYLRYWHSPTGQEAARAPPGRATPVADE